MDDATGRAIHEGEGVLRPDLLPLVANTMTCLCRTFPIWTCSTALSAAYPASGSRHTNSIQVKLSRNRRRLTPLLLQVYQELCKKHTTFRERSENTDLAVRSSNIPLTNFLNQASTECIMRLSPSASCAYYAL